MPRGPKPKPAIARALGTVLFTPGPLDSFCWVQDRATTADGYVQVRVNGKLMYAHRLLYEAMVGPIPEGLTLDHLCRVRACCNPTHVEPVTRGENIRRGETGMWSHGGGRPVNTDPLCSKGLHPRIPRQRCRECARAYQREYSKIRAR